MRHVVFVVLGLCASGCLTPLHRLEDSLVYHPTKPVESWLPPPPHVKVEDVWLEADDGERIHAWHFTGPLDAGAMLFCHGNAGNISRWAPRAWGLQQKLSRSVLVFDYPGFGKSSGKPSERGCYTAAGAAFDWLVNERKIPAKKIVLCGESLGGGVATELASRRPHQALVLIRTFTSIPDVARSKPLVWSSAPLMHNDFDNLARIVKHQTPLFVAHGDKDQLIPFAQGKRLFDAAPGPKRFYHMKDCGHMDPYPDDMYRELKAFLQ